MMRKCHLNTCPVGVATQDPELRKKFSGQPEHVVNFFFYVAEDLRRIMAQLGFRTVNEMVGRVDCLVQRTDIEHWKAKSIDLSAVLYDPPVPSHVGRRVLQAQDHGLEDALDRKLIEMTHDAIENRNPVQLSMPIRNIHRTVGTMLSGEVARKYGSQGLPEDTIRVQFTGCAGQSFGAFLAKGITMTLEGDGNDYVGKGLSGGKLVVYHAREIGIRASRKTFSSATCACTARRAVKLSSAAWPASASRCAIPAQLPLSKASATMAAST